MPGFTFTDLQIVTALAIGDLVPGRHSPLRLLRAFSRPASQGDADFDQLVDLGFVHIAGGAWQLNPALAAVLRAAIAPDEAIDVVFSDRDTRDPFWWTHEVAGDDVRLPRPGVTILRRGNLVFECSVDRNAWNVRLFFPLEREAVFDRLLTMVAGTRILPPPVGFRFLGTADEAFALTVALLRLRSDPRPARLDELVRIVMADAADATHTQPIDVMTGTSLLELASDTTGGRARAALERLVANGHLIVASGLVDASAEATAVLDAGLRLLATVSRAEFDGVPDGEAERRATVHVMRVGGHVLAFRQRSSAAGVTMFEWTDVDAEQLRWLVASVVLPADELARQLAPDDQVEAAATHDEHPPTVPASEPAAIASTWAPTHTVPAEGLTAWARPDGSLAPVARLDPYLDVRLVQRHNGFAQVLCENGWSCWVDGRRLP